MYATDRTDRPMAPLAAGLLLWLAAAPASFAQGPALAAKPPVGDVIVRGSRVIPPQQVQSLMKTRAGDPYDPDLLQEDIRVLAATKNFGNVRAEYETRPDGRVNVYVLISDFPNTIQKITFLGAKHLKDRELEELSNLRVGQPLNPTANKIAAVAIANRLKEQGRPFAHVELLKGDKPGDAEVVFVITEGPITQVSEVSVTGNTFVSAAVLKTHLLTSARFIGIGGKFNPAMVEADVAKLTEYYKTFGFHDVRVSRELRWSADGGAVAVLYHVVEGVQYRVAAAPTVQGVKSAPDEEIRRLSGVKGGDLYDQRAVDGDVQRIKDYLGYQGREVRVQATALHPRDTPGVCTVQYQVEEVPPARLGQVFVIGNTRTRRNVVLRELPPGLAPGQTLSFPDVRVAERRLAQLGIFSSPDGSQRPRIEVLPAEDNEFRDLAIYVDEQNTGSLLFGVGVNSDSGLTGSIVLNENNFDILRFPRSVDDLLSGGAFRGAGQSLRLEAVPGTELQRYTFSFRDPRLFDSVYSLGVSGYYYTRDFDEYRERRLGGQVNLGRKLGDYWTVSGGLRMENVEVRNIPFGAPPEITRDAGDNFLIASRLGVTYDDRDSVLRPTRGMIVDVNGEYGFGDQKFPKVTADVNKYWTVVQRNDGSGKHVLAYHGQVGWSGDETPVFERFYAGGFRSLRGFGFRGVGPDVNGFKVGGNFILLNSLEYQIPIRANDQMFVVGFVDSGTVEADIDRLNNYRVSAGFGFRFVVPMLGPVPIALDFGFPVVKGPNDREQIFAFWLGFFR